MSLKRIVEGAYLVPMGNANAILLDAGQDLVLVDAGFAGKEAAVLDTLRELGRAPHDLKHLVFTHGHPDHIGSAAALVRATGASTYMHQADVPLAETGGPFRPMTPAPGLIQRGVFRMVWKPEERMQPFGIDRPFVDGDTLPAAGGLRAVHLPGHCAGQVAFLWQGNRLLIAGDVCMNLFGLADPIGFEDLEEGRRSQRELAALAGKVSVEAACFGHGRPIKTGAARKLQKAFG